MTHRHALSSSNLFTRSLPLTVLTLLFASLLFALCSLRVAAQSATATLSGTVEDQNGAVVPGATVTVRNPNTGLNRQTTTNDAGYFTVALLTPGTYTVRAQHDGFKIVQIDIVLNVGDQKALQIQLPTGDVKEVVNVTGEAPLINESPAVGTVVDRQFVANLPLNGRSFQSLISLTPGVVVTKTAGGEQGQFSVNGQRASANYFTVDGVSANVGVIATILPGQSGAGSLPGLSASGGTNNLVSVDALQEFKIQTSTYAPEFGRTPGAQVSIVTRSGTDQFHGSLFDYVRNEVFDANDWFANSIPLTAQQVAQGLTKQKRAPLRQNDFGVVVGGPIYMPRFGEGGPTLVSGKHRAFFFLSYEGLRLRQPLTGITDVPSLATRQAASAGIQPFLNLYPKPNGADKANGLAAFNSSFSNPATLNATSIRIDGVASNKLTLFGRYNYSPSETVARGGVIQTLNTLSHFNVNTHTLTFGSTYLLTPTISNDLRLNYSRNRASSFFTLDDFGGAVVPPDSVIFPSSRSSKDAGITISLTGALQGAIVWGRRPQPLQRQFNIADGLSVVRGNHQLKFGVDYRRLSPTFSLQDYLATLTFNSVGTPGSPAAGSLLSGRAASASISSQQGPQIVIFNNLSLYAQDTWKIVPRLTLTYGLRWEVNPPPHEANGNDPLTLTQIDTPSTFVFAPRGTPLWKTTHDNFAPRVGLSYQLFEKQGRETVLRGGFGLFYDLGDGPAANAFVGSFPFTALKSLTNVPFPLSATDAAAPIAGLNPSATDSFFAFDPRLKLPRVYQWNLSIEQSLGSSQTITASYVAAVGRRLLRQGVLRNPNANFPGSVFIATNDATSDYHAMQLQFQRRLSRGLQALASYTWSKSLDIVSADSISGTPANGFDPRQDRGPSDFDVRHAFSGAVTYNLPSPHVGNIVKKILSDWSLDCIGTARSATPINVVYSATTSFGTLTLRPDLVTGIPFYLNDPTVPGGRRFNNTRVTITGNPNPQIGPFLRPTVARQGTLGRNALRGFPVWQLDLALRRQFTLKENVNLQLKAEFFNILNHPNFGDPVGSLTSSTFGVSTAMLGRSLGTSGLAGGFNPLYQVGGARSTQLSLRLQF